MNIELYISPCPNDTFMFDAMLHGRVDTEGLVFNVNFEDIEQLNRGVLDGRSAVSKISYAVFPFICDNYLVLDSGSALGTGNGPLLVCRKGTSHDLKGAKVAVPGMNTTACKLLQKFYPQIAEVRPLLFSDIADAVEHGGYDAGVLIHEGRFTYGRAGLDLISDLGKLWEMSTNLPLPLGGIVVPQAFEPKLRVQIGRILRRSVEFAFANPEVSTQFVRTHAKELDENVINSHITLFVNNFSVNLGAEGRRAVAEFTALDESLIFEAHNG